MVGVGGATVHLAWQIGTVDLGDFNSCLAKFRSNRDLGALVLLGVGLGQLV